MNVAIADTLPVALISDDESIERTLAEFDAKVKVWSSAVLEAQSILRNITEQQDVQSDTAPELPEEEHVSEESELPADEPPDYDCDDEPQDESEEINPVALQEEDNTDTHQDHDEMLLNSVDDKIAQRIRVIRRLNPGNKSVEELIDELNVKVNPKSQTPKKSGRKLWWRK